MIIYQLLRPVLGYLSIQHPTKRFVDWGLPTFFALIGTVCIYFIGHKFNFFGSGGFISLILGYVQNLPGFYIAALVAIATFARADIDVLMPGDPPPRIRSEGNGGVTNLIQLTRRRFLSLLFAFLTAECIFLTLLSVVFIAVAIPMREFFTAELYPAFYHLSVFFYFLYWRNL